MIFKSSEIIIHPEQDVFWRYFAAFGFAAIAMTSVASLALLLSLFAENSIGPIVATMSIIIFFHDPDHNGSSFIQYTSTIYFYLAYARLERFFRPADNLSQCT